MATVSGYVEKIKYRNEENGYSMLKCQFGWTGLCTGGNLSVYQ